MHGLQLYECLVDTMTVWHSEALRKYFCLITKNYTRRRKMWFPTFFKICIMSQRLVQRRFVMKSYDDLKAKMEEMQQQLF